MVYCMVLFHSQTRRYMIKSTTHCEHVIGERENELGFTITPRLSRRLHQVMLTDPGLADDIALISN